MDSPRCDIEHDDAMRIAMRLEKRDALGVLTHPGMPDEGWQVHDEHVLAFARHTLGGHFAISPDARRAALSGAARALLAHMGAAPDAVAALVSEASGLGLVDHEGERWCVMGVVSDSVDAYDEDRRGGDDGGRSERRLASLVMHLPGLEFRLETWDEGETPIDAIAVDALPRAALAAAVGRPLRDVVSHPALDPLPLVVLRVTERGALVIREDA